MNGNRTLRQLHRAWIFQAVLAGIFVFADDAPASSEPATAAAERTMLAVLTRADQDAASAAQRTRTHATLKKARPAVAHSVRIAPAADEKTAASASPADPRATERVVSVSGVGPGQAGYVHFFIVRGPGGGEWETQVGIELPDQRIAWSFLDLGVVVSDFIENGVVPVNRKLYEVQYLYGLRPFPDAEAMYALQSEIEARVLPWAEAETPYCIVRGPSDPQCVSCLGFVLRILFPGASPAYALLPRDFERVALKTIYTTDDLLLYFAGVLGMRDKETRLKRVDELALPENLREDVVRLVNTSATYQNVADPAAAPAANIPPPARRVAKPVQQRAAPQPGKS